MFVQPKSRWHGVGAHLVEACEEKAREHTGGLAVIAYPDSLFMPPASSSSMASRLNVACLRLPPMKNRGDVGCRNFCCATAPGARRPENHDIFWCGQCLLRRHARDECCIKKCTSWARAATVRGSIPAICGILEQRASPTAFTDGQCVSVSGLSKREPRGEGAAVLPR
jgi:hypothetical protein